MVKAKGQMWLLLAISCASLFGAAFSQTQCTSFPNAEFIRSTVEQLVSSSGGEGNNPMVTLVDHHPTCIAVGNTLGSIQSLSIVVKYNVTSDSVTNVQRINQLLLTCSGGTFMPQSTSRELNQPESLFNLTTRRDCFVCATTSSGGVTVDPEANCAECPICAGGQGGCLTQTDCCRFYDVVNRTCINTCPAGSVNMTDFTCDPCLSSPCQNQGVCTALSSTTFNCTCTGSFTGMNCDMCSLTCMNQGTPNSGCTACMCPTGYTGTDCSMNIDDCASNPCGANGQCTDGLNSFTCNCNPPYTGTTCDTCMLPDCARCVNAECVECNRGLTWNRNERRCVDFCFSNPCQNGGTCTIEDDSYMCQCPTGRTGMNCTMCDSGFTLVNSECAPCRDTRCLTCSNGVDICSQCMDGFQVDDNMQCRTGEDSPLPIILGVIFGLLALVVIITIIVIVAIVVWRKKVQEKATNFNDFNKPGAKVTENLLYVSEKDVVSQTVE